MGALSGRIALLTAMKEEQQWLLDHCLRVERVKGEHGVYLALMNQVPVLLARCGVGKVHAAIACARALAWQPRCLVMVGSAASLRSELEVGHFVLGLQLAHHDVDLVPFGYLPGQLPSCPQFFHSDAQLAQQAGKLLSQGVGTTWQQGLVVSGDQFVTRHHLSRIQSAFPQAIAVEMEGAAAAQACHCFRLPILVLRVVSDCLLQPQDNAEQFAQFLTGPHGNNLGNFVSRLVPHLNP